MLRGNGERTGREQCGARVETVFRQGGEEERARLGARPQTGRPGRRLTLDRRVERLVRRKRARRSVGARIAGLPGIKLLAARRDLNPERGPGIFAAKFRKLPLPPEQPERIVHPRFQAGKWIASDRLRLEPR